MSKDEARLVKCHVCQSPVMLEHGESKYGIEVFTCIGCGAEYNKKGQFLQLPWHKEPKKDELIPCTGIELYNAVYQYYFDNVVFHDPFLYVLKTLHALHTYKIDEFDSTGVMGYVSSGNEAGKTRALVADYEINHRAVVTTAPTIAFTKRAMEDGCTLLLDQAEDSFYDAKGNKTIMYNIFTSRTTRGISLGQLGMDYTYDMRSVFGVKNFTMQDDGTRDNPIERRTFIIAMQHGEPNNKYLDTTYRLKKGKKVKHDPTIIRRMAYWFKYQKIPYNEDTFLTGGIADMMDPLIWTARMLQLPEHIIEQLYKYAFKMKYAKVQYAAETNPAKVCKAVGACIRVSKQFKTDDIIARYVEMYPEEKEKSIKALRSKVGKALSNIDFEKDKNVSTNYDFNIPSNLEKFDRWHGQFTMNSIDDKIDGIKKEMLEHGAEFSKSIESHDKFDMYVKMLKYREMFMKLKDVPVQEPDLVEPDDIEPPEQPDTFSIIDDDEEQPENPDQEILQHIQQEHEEAYQVTA